jgi:hypothetical protein
MGLGHSPSIDTSSLQLLLDAANPRSHPGSGTTWTDLSGNGRDFTLNGPLKYYQYAGVLFFDGVDDHATSSYAPVFTGDFTISFWVNFDVFGDYQNVISSANNGNAAYGFWLEFGSVRGFTLYSGLNGTNALVLEDNVVSLSISTGVWYHVCITRSGSGTNNIKLYVNNVLCGQNTYTSTIGVSSQNLMLAKYSYDAGNTWLFAGFLANLTIQHSAVSAETIAKNYSALKNRFDNFWLVTPPFDGAVLFCDAGRSEVAGAINSTGVWRNLAVARRNGTLTNGPYYSYINGGCVLFDGIDDCVVIASNLSILSNAAYTKIAWVYFTSFSTGNNLISGGNLGTNHALFLQTQNKVYAGHNGNWSTVSSNSTLSLNTWYMIGVTFNTTSGWVIYINGVADGTSSNTATFTSGQGELLIGAYGTGTNVLSGRMAIANVFNRVLTADEMQQHFATFRWRFGL